MHPVNILHRKLIVAWKSYNSDSDEWATTYKNNIEIADHKELVEALGFDPDKVTAEVIAEAYEITGYLFDDEASRTLIKQFAKDFALAQDRTEWAEFAGGAIFEIVLSAVIVGLTGGLGAAVVAAKSTRHVGKLAELGKVLKKLADKLKAVKLRKVKTGHTGEAVKVKLDKPSEVEFGSHGQDVDVGSKNIDMVPELDVVPKRITTVHTFDDGLKMELPTNLQNVEPNAVRHAVLGDFNTKGRMTGGGHGQDNIDHLIQNNMPLNVEHEFSNGVRVGNIPNHKNKAKRTGDGQAWFPESWNPAEIAEAGEVIFKKQANGGVGPFFDTHNGVNIGIFVDPNTSKVSTIFPHNRSQP